MSGSLDLVSLTLSIAFFNIFSLISIEWSGSVKGQSWKLSKFSVPSSLNTLTKKLFRILAFSWLSLVKSRFGISSSPKLDFFHLRAEIAPTEIVVNLNFAS